MCSQSPSPATQVAGSEPEKLSCPEIAKRIRQKGGKLGTCNRTTVWRAIQKLGITPVFEHGNIKLYTLENMALILANLRFEEEKRA